MGKHHTKPRHVRYAVLIITLILMALWPTVVY